MERIVFNQKKKMPIMLEINLILYILVKFLPLHNAQCVILLKCHVLNRYTKSDDFTWHGVLFLLFPILFVKRIYLYAGYMLGIAGYICENMTNDSEIDWNIDVFVYYSMIHS